MQRPCGGSVLVCLKNRKEGSVLKARFRGEVSGEWVRARAENDPADRGVLKQDVSFGFSPCVSSWNFL